MRIGGFFESFLKKVWKKFGGYKKTPYLCTRNSETRLTPYGKQNLKVGSVAQLNRASDYGSEGCGFESRRNHKKRIWIRPNPFFISPFAYEMTRRSCALTLSHTLSHRAREGSFHYTLRRAMYGKRAAKRISPSLPLNSWHNTLIWRKYSLLHHTLCHHRTRNLEETCDVGTLHIVDIAVGLGAVLHTVGMDIVHDIAELVVYLFTAPAQTL